MLVETKLDLYESINHTYSFETLCLVYIHCVYQKSEEPPCNLLENSEAFAGDDP